MTNMTTHQHDGGCHCGAVRFRVRLLDGFSSARRCTCTYCRMRGAIALSAKLDAFDVVQGEDNLTLYQFNTGTAKHYFCHTCGIYTHHQRRSDPTQFGVNMACLDGVSPFDLPEVQVTDGVSHPSDTGGGSRIVGILRFIPAG